MEMTQLWKSEKAWISTAAWKSPAKSCVTLPHSHRHYWSIIKLKIIKNEKIQVAHPGLNPVFGIATKQKPNRRRNQDAIEDYSESGAEVQVLCLQISENGRNRRRVGHFH